MAQVPTVRIVHPTAKGGYARINLSDFDPARHVLFDPLPKQEQIQDDVPRETSRNHGETAAKPAETTEPVSAPRKRGRPRKTEV